MLLLFLLNIMTSEAYCSSLFVLTRPEISMHTGQTLKGPNAPS